MHQQLQEHHQLQNQSHLHHQRAPPMNSATINPATAPPTTPSPPSSTGAPPEQPPKPSPLMDHRTVREALMSTTSAQAQMVKNEMVGTPPASVQQQQQQRAQFSPMAMGFDAITPSDGLSALSVVGTMMMKHEANGAGGGGPQVQTFGDFDYMNMMQPLHLAAIGRHSSHGSERHLSTESAITQAPAPIPTTKRSRSTHDGLMKCTFCPKKLNDEAEFERHQMECRLQRSHECDTCGKRFKARGGLQQHMRIHNNEKAYICQYCNKTFTQKSHLDQHERIHTGIKPFPCTFCGRTFRQRSQQMGHESTHLSHYSSASARQTPSQGEQTTPSSSSSTSSGSSGAKREEGNEVGNRQNGQVNNGQMLIHPTPPTPSPEQQQHLNMAAVMMQQMHNQALLGLNGHDFHGQHHQFGQSAAEATANGMRMLSHIAS